MKKSSLKINHFSFFVVLGSCQLNQLRIRLEDIQWVSLFVPVLAAVIVMLSVTAMVAV